MDGSIANLADGMENVGDFSGRYAFEAKPSERFLESLSFAKVEGVSSSNALTQQLGELPELEDSRVGVIVQVTLGGSSVSRQAGIVRR